MSEDFKDILYSTEPPGRPKYEVDFVFCNSYFVEKTSIDNQSDSPERPGRVSSVRSVWFRGAGVQIPEHFQPNTAAAVDIYYEEYACGF